MTADRKKVEHLVGIIKDKAIDKETLNIVNTYPKIEKSQFPENPDVDLNRQLIEISIESSRRIVEKFLDCFFKEYERIMQLSLNDKEVEELTDFFSSTDMEKWDRTPRFLRKKLPHSKKFAAISATAHQNANIYMELFQIEEKTRMIREAQRLIEKSIAAEKKDRPMYG